MAEQLLPRLAPTAVGLSVSTSPDLAVYGLTETHLRMALGEIARAVLLAGGRLVYGGHLDPDGYTAFLVSEVERFGSRNRALTAYIPWPAHRELPSAEVRRLVDDISVLGNYVFLSADGRPLMDRAEMDPEPDDASLDADALTAARGVMTAAVDARVVVGGATDGFRGSMPGVIEETVLAIRAAVPVFIAGGFGGAAADIAFAAGGDPANWLRRDTTDTPGTAALKLAIADAGWRITSNGLTQEENQRLAVTYRASEVASLVVTGLKRLTRS